MVQPAGAACAGESHVAKNDSAMKTSTSNSMRTGGNRLLHEHFVDHLLDSVNNGPTGMADLFD